MQRKGGEKVMEGWREFVLYPPKYQDEKPSTLQDRK